MTQKGWSSSPDKGGIACDHSGQFRDWVVLQVRRLLLQSCASLCSLSCSSLLFVLQPFALCPAALCSLSCSLCPAVLCSLSCSPLLFVLQPFVFCPAALCSLSCSPLFFVLQSFVLYPAVLCSLSCSPLFFVLQPFVLCPAAADPYPMLLPAQTVSAGHDQDERPCDAAGSARQRGRHGGGSFASTCLTPTCLSRGAGRDRHFLLIIQCLIIHLFTLAQEKKEAFVLGGGGGGMVLHGEL